MNGPGRGDTSSENPHARLSSLKEGLLLLHKALIESERIEYERTFGPIDSPNAFLNLLMSDPWFAWLRPVSMMVVSIDETLESGEPLSSQTLGDLRSRTRALLAASEEGDGFARSYFEALQRTPEVVLAHAALKELLKN